MKIRFDRALDLYLLFAALGFAALIAVFFPFTAEDAWIVARYARNAVEHGELVFNRGEFVNALTSPLDAMLRIVLHEIAPDPMLAHKLCGVVLGAATLGLGVTALRGDRVAQSVFLALTALSAPFALWTVGGLETPVLALLATGFTTCLWRTLPERLLPAAFLAGLAFLARHDSVLFIAPALLWALRHERLPRWIGICAAAGAAPVAWLGFAFFYFHDFLPTSFHIKGPGNVAPTLGTNALYLLDFLLQSGLALVLVAALCIAAARGRPAGAAAGDRAGLWMGLGAAVALYGLLVATGHMMFSFRLFVPYLPVMALLSSELLAKAAAGMAAVAMRRIAGALLAVLSLMQLTLAYAIERLTLNPARVGEYQNIGAADYRRAFIDTLPEAAAAIEADWRAASAGQAPRVLTFAAGLLPWRLPEAYIFEALVSWRRECLPDPRKHALLADYVHLVTPWSGTLDEQLPGPRDRWTVIWQRTALFDKQFHTWMVFRNERPDPGVLPAYVDGPCRLPAPQESQTR